MPDHIQPAAPPSSESSSRSHSPAHAPTDPTDTLRQTAAEAVLAVPGVSKLEPTLRNALNRLHTTATRLTTNRTPTKTSGTTHIAAEGINITQQDTVIDIHVDIAVTPTQPAHLTAQHVQTALTQHITAHQLTPGTITVAVLTIEH